MIDTLHSKMVATNLEAELGGTVRPDPQHVCVENGVTWFEFNATYRDTQTGQTFNVTFWALDHADAERRIRCIRETAEVTGQIYATYPET